MSESTTVIYPGMSLLGPISEIHSISISSCLHSSAMNCAFGSVREWAFHCNIFNVEFDILRGTSSGNCGGRG